MISEACSCVATPTTSTVTVGITSVVTAPAAQTMTVETTSPTVTTFMDTVTITSTLEVQSVDCLTYWSPSQPEPTNYCYLVDVNPSYTYSYDDYTFSHAIDECAAQSWEGYSETLGNESETDLNAGFAYDISANAWNCWM